MASVHEYKRLEDNIVKETKKAGASVGIIFIDLIKGLGRFLARRYTVVFVPHSEKKLYNLHISVLSVFCFFLVLFGIAGGLFWHGFSQGNSRYSSADASSHILSLEMQLEQLRAEAANLIREARAFEMALAGTFDAVGANIGGGPTLASGFLGGDLGAFVNVWESQDGVLQEVDELRRISAYLARAAVPVREVGAMAAQGIGTQNNALLSEIPSIWPVQDGMGRITMGFGRNTNPFTGLFYIHRGIDISTGRSGDPVVAAADGQVVTIDFDPGFGNFLVIRHRHGYYTRYAHMLSFNVRIGQHVRQGEVIGLIGNTGLSTGPHLHFEVHVGSDVVNPYRYINIRPRSFRPAL
ncbi:MAG: M23 family metallopeptidase [Spirochaetes bacterium]|nr:M23 family metallopeptidase [Spirochaetota bacterium]